MQPITSVKVYLAVFGALVLLTAATVGAAVFVDLGALSAAVAVGIATVKAILVLVYFMHLSHSKHLTRVMAAAGFFGLLILLVLIFGDYQTREWLQIYFRP